MQNRSSSQAVRPRPRWAAVAALGQLQWFLGNVYEAVVDVPQLLVDAHPCAPKLQNSHDVALARGRTLPAAR